MLFKEIVDGRTDTRTPDIKGSHKPTKHFVLRWAKNSRICFFHKNAWETKIQLFVA